MEQDMEYRSLGRSGLKVSVLSYGAWITFSNQFGEATASQCMSSAYDAGVNFFDNAEVYADGQAEILMGTVLKKLGWSRDSFLVSSKVFWGGSKPTQRGLSRKHIVDACHGALKRLQVDYLDLFFCHRPDVSTPIEETVRAMNELIWQGKILYWGTSEWSAAQIMGAHRVARQYNLVPPTMEQPQYNMLHRDRVEAEYGPLYEEVGLGLTTFSPLASGFLTGKYITGVGPGTRFDLPGYEWLKARFLGPELPVMQTKLKRLMEIAQDLGISLTSLALAWCVKNTHVSTVITGASKLEQLQENLKALESVPKLTTEVMSSIEGVLGNTPAKPPVF